MPRVFVGLGSNVEPEANLGRALRSLARDVPVQRLSMVYRTPPFGGPPGQADFCNCVAELATELPPLELRAVLRRIEAELGRRRGPDRNAPRTADLDLLLWGELVVATAELTLPAPQILEQPFVLVPLAELAPELHLPGDGRTLGALATRLAAALGDRLDEVLRPLPALFFTLRREFVHR